MTNPLSILIIIVVIITVVVITVVIITVAIITVVIIIVVIFTVVIISSNSLLVFVVGTIFCVSGLFFTIITANMCC